MPKLSDTQAALLAAAVARPDLSVLPAPETLGLKGAALARTLKELRDRGLIAAAPAERRAKRSKWADPAADAGDRECLIVTPAGRAAIAAEPAGHGDTGISPEGTSSARTTKTAALITLLSASGGADIAALSTALGWLPHTTRAALTRLRQAGYGLEAIAPPEGGARRYRIVATPKPAAGA